MWRQEVKAKELAIAQVQKELRLKNEAKVNINRKRDALLRKIEINCQRNKDDKKRLEQEISCLQLSLDSSNPHHLPDAFYTAGLEQARPERDPFEMLPSLNEALEYCEEEKISDRVCLFCRESEASVVFLPCAHQVLCANCTEDHYKNAEAKWCPCCQDLIAQIIRVYGSGS